MNWCPWCGELFPGVDERDRIALREHIESCVWNPNPPVMVDDPSRDL